MLQDWKQEKLQDVLQEKLQDVLQDMQNRLWSVLPVIPQEASSKSSTSAYLDKSKQQNKQEIS